MVGKETFFPKKLGGTGQEPRELIQGLPNLKRLVVLEIWAPTNGRTYSQKS